MPCWHEYWLALPSTFCDISIVFLCVYSWWGPALTCSAWCPSWCLSSFLSWSSFFLSSSNSSQRCCPPPSRQSPKRHVFMYTQTHTLQPEWPRDRVHYDYITSQIWLWLLYLWLCRQLTLSNLGNLLWELCIHTLPKPKNTLKSFTNTRPDPLLICLLLL